MTFAHAAVPARQVRAALGFARVIRSRHVDIAGRSNLVLTPRDDLLDHYLATDSREISSLPARELPHQVTAWKAHILLEHFNLTDWWTWVATSPRAGMVAILLRPRARLHTVNSIMKHL